MSAARLSDQAKAALDTIAKKSGKLHPKDVVRAAAKKESPLHRYFQWDDSKAAAQYRLEQARDLIQVYVRIVPNVGPVRAYVAVREKSGSDGYIATDDAVRDRVTRKTLIAQMVADVEAVLKRYSFLEPVAGKVFAAIRSALR